VSPDRPPSHGYPETLVAEVAAALGSEHVPTCTAGRDCSRCRAWSRRARRARAYLARTDRLLTPRAERYVRAMERKWIARWLAGPAAREVVHAAHAEAIATGTDTAGVVCARLAERVRQGIGDPAAKAE
jgi:hypothetical protein